MDSEANDYYSLSDATWSGLGSDQGSNIESSDDESIPELNSKGQGINTASTNMPPRTGRMGNQWHADLRWDYSTGSQLMGGSNSTGDAAPHVGVNSAVCHGT